ncbi:uncharacterized protein LOC110433188 isoform X2 [Sorghum bicolor]|uniref:uncharacterized protein LOC110433188 isoform X2 n=1 Tax=Sorghum bicolor TaxID=4558 RepID=UPI000B425413|nr:uncharacterized protein LOC110433188 isoform X2 [Sorghum bicolor]|eukprot:XP_021310651.1 uncharacterized protein LOC110433188 isoform X2 [Sorghum bicolor]
MAASAHPRTHRDFSPTPHPRPPATHRAHRRRSSPLSSVESAPWAQRHPTWRSPLPVAAAAPPPSRRGGGSFTFLAASVASPPPPRPDLRPHGRGGTTNRRARRPLAVRGFPSPTSGGWGLRRRCGSPCAPQLLPGDGGASFSLPCKLCREYLKGSIRTAPSFRRTVCEEKLMQPIQI